MANQYSSIMILFWSEQHCIFLFTLLKFNSSIQASSEKPCPWQDVDFRDRQISAQIPAPLPHTGCVNLDRSGGLRHNTSQDVKAAPNWLQESGATALTGGAPYGW